MKNIYLVLFLLALSLNAMSFNFYQEYPLQSKVIKGIHYPQNYRTLYSGTGNSGYSLDQAIRGMFGYEDAHYYSSTARRVLKYIRKGSVGATDTLIDYTIFLDKAQEVVRNSMLVNIVQNYLLRSGEIRNSADEMKALDDIMGEYFSRLGHRNVNESFFGYIRKIEVTHDDIEISKVHSGRIAWPSETVYSSMHQFIAMLYGQNVVVFNEKEEPHSIDIGFWNFINNGYWYESHKDAGEFVAGTMIPSRFIEGFQVREKTGMIFKKGLMKYVPVYNKINYSFYKEKIAGETIVVAVKNNTQSGCMVRTAPFKYNICYPQYSLDSLNDILIKPKKIKDVAKKCKKFTGVKKEKCLGKLRQLVSEMQIDPNKFAKVSSVQVPIMGFFKKENSTISSVPTEISRNLGRLASTNEDELKWFSKVLREAELSDEIVFTPAIQ